MHHSDSVRLGGENVFQTISSKISADSQLSALQKRSDFGTFAEMHLGALASVCALR